MKRFGANEALSAKYILKWRDIAELQQEVDCLDIAADGWADVDLDVRVECVLTADIIEILETETILLGRAAMQIRHIELHSRHQTNQPMTMCWAVDLMRQTFLRERAIGDVIYVFSD